MSKSVLARLQDMLEAIGELQRATEGKSFEEYQHNWILRKGAERAVEIISEASRHLPEDLKSLHPYPRWRQVAGIGNVLRHEYHRVDDRIVWSAVQDELPQLKPYLERMVEELTNER